MTIRRLPDWQSRLSRYLAEAARRPFVHGRHDCALFAADALAAMTGTDLGAAYRGRYTTLRGGLRIMRRSGHADHVAYFAAHLRLRAPAERARVGDLAVMIDDGIEAMGVVQGAAVYALRESGLGMVPLARSAAVFEVA